MHKAGWEARALIYFFSPLLLVQVSGYFKDCTLALAPGSSADTVPGDDSAFKANMSAAGAQ